MASERVIEELRKEAERIEEDSDFTAQGHYNASAVWKSGHRWLGILATIASALTAGAALKEYSREAVAICSVIAGVLTAVLTFLRPSEESDRHHRAGDQSLAVRNRVRFFRNIDLLTRDKTDKELVESLRALTDERNVVLKASPIIPRRAFERARKDIEAGTTTHKIDVR